MCMQRRQWEVVRCKYSGRADPPNGRPWLIWSTQIPWNSLKTQCLTNCKKILSLRGGLSMYCVEDIKSFPMSRRDIGYNPTSFESELSRRSKKPWRFIRLLGLTLGNPPFRRIWLMLGLPLTKLLTRWKIWWTARSSPDTKISDARSYLISIWMANSPGKLVLSPVVILLIYQHQ